MSRSQTALRQLPYDQQLLLLRERVAERRGLAELLAETAVLSDHEPFAQLVLLLGKVRLLQALAEPLQAALGLLPDTGVQRLLAALGQSAELAPPERQTLVAAIVATLEVLPLVRVAAICLLDRWLKNEAPAEREALIERARRVVLDAFEARAVSEAVVALDDALLLRLPGQQLRALPGSLATDARGAWNARLALFAARVLEVLETQPKSLSQANAEQLLARRVYTDPGHFLVELLQNADDARAQAWHVSVHDDRAKVWHDGLPFDAKDVVGVLSIGQTTKARDQIGFFGVGFKAVYELCERPQVYSEPFCFEIADVSVPRRLAERPSGSESGGTLLVLPFRGGADAARAQRLYERARSLPPQTLLTLQSLRSWTVARGEERWTARATAEAGGRVCLHSELRRGIGSDREHVEVDETRYLVAADRFERAEAGQGTARSGEAAILVALALDAAGRPTPLAPGAPTIFAFLPTGERSGLRLLVHAPFQLPVDRERLDPTAPSNAWALARAGELLLRLVRQQADAAAQQQGAALDLRALLGVLPRAEELSHPAYAVLCRALAEGGADVGFLPAADGAPLTPRRAWLCSDDALVRLLADVEVDQAGGRLLASLPARERALCLDLGARPFAGVELLRWLEDVLSALDDGHTPAQPWLQGGALAELWAALARLLVSASAAPRAGARVLEVLASLPLLPDATGRLYRAAAIVRAPARLRALYAPVRVLLASGFDPPPLASVEQLFVDLGLRELDDDDLLADLADGERCAALLGGAEADVEARLAACERLLTVLATIPAAARRVVAEAHAFVAADGSLRPLRGSEALWLVADTPLGRWLRAHAPQVALVHEALAAQQALLAELGASFFDLEELLSALARDGVELSDEALWQLHELLARSADELPPRWRQRLARAAIFFDRQGRRRVLLGDEPALLPADEALVELAPAAPWLAARLLALGFVQRLAPVLGAEALARRLLLEDVGAPLFDPFAETPEGERALRAAYDYLAAHAGTLPAALARRLAAAPLWLAADGRRLELKQLRRPALPAFDRLYRAGAGAAGLADAAALTLATALGLEQLVAAVGPAQLVEDLADGLGELDDALRPQLLAALATAAQTLPAAALAPLLRVPLFIDQGGRRAALARWTLGELPKSEEPRCYRVMARYRSLLARGSRALLSERDEAELAPLWARLELPAAGLSEALDAILHDGSLQDATTAQRARDLLLDLATEEGGAAALRPHRAVLEKLALWPAESGSLWRPAVLLRAKEAEAALGASWRDVLDADTRVLSADAEACASGLASHVTFRDPLDPLLDRLQSEARVDAPLATQPSFLATRERLVDLLARLAQRGASVEELSALPLFVNGCEQLVAGPRFAASAEVAALLTDLPLAAKLLDGRWLQLARAALDAELLAALCPPLPLRSWLSALADARREPIPRRAATAAPSLADQLQRERLYRLLETHATAIAADAQAAGLLGRAHVIPDREELLRAPRELLLVSAEHPELMALGGVPAAEVPATLLRWFAATYQLEERQQELVLERLLPAHAEAVQRRDGSTARRLLDAIAELLRAEDAFGMQEALERLPTRFKLHRQLRIETVDHRWLRPRSLFLASAERTQLLRDVLAEPPPLPSPGHEAPRVMALLRACGAASRLDDAAIDALLSEIESEAQALQEPGDAVAALPGGLDERRARLADRTLALARYLALELADEPQLSQRLRLDRRAWLPDGAGVARVPRELYWPDARTRALVGDRPERFPHPELLFAAPVVLRERLPFRRPEEATIADIADELRRAPPASDELLRWLEDGLKRRRLDAAALREALQDLPCLRDDSWVLRAPAALCCEGAQELFGDRGGDWSAARTYRRLSSALGIPSRPGPRQIVDVCAEIAEDLRAEGAERLLAEEPTLLDRLPRCLALLAARPPASLPAASALPIVVLAPTEDGADELTLVLADDARLCLDEEDATGLRPLWPDDEPEAARRLLRRLRGESRTDQLAGRQRLTRDAAPSTSDPSALEAEETGLLARLGRWLRGKNRDEAEATAPEVPARAETRAERRRREREERERLRELQRAVARREREEAREQRRAEQREAEQRETEREYREAERRRQERGDETDDRRREPDATTKRPRRRGAPPADEPAPEERDWFRPREAINEQLGAHRGWIQDRSRAPSYGFSFAPRRLPAPWIYAPQIVSAVFDSAVQRWLPMDLDPGLFAGGPRDVGTVEVSGRVPVGHVLLPVPAYGRVVEVDCQDDARWLEGGGGRALLHTRSEQTVRYRITLAEAPDFEAGAAASPQAAVDGALLAPTVDAEELPLEVLELLLSLREDQQRAPLSIALELRDMVRRRYRYDPSYLEDPQMARWLRSLAAGRPNMHIAALHAGRDARHLGRGVCYELNVLLCELLRRVGIPAVVASGWTFDRGTLAEPDHLWALALLPTPVGPRFCPLDASTTQSGRPLHAGERPPGPWRVGDGGRVPEQPRWQESQRKRGRGSRRRSGSALEQTRPPTRELARVLTYLSTTSLARPAADQEALLRRCRTLLADPHFAETLRALLEEDDA